MGTPERIFNNLNKLKYRFHIGKLFKSSRVSFSARTFDVNESFLSVEEKKLFNVLKAVVTDERLDATVRIAGGWIRDKLLGKSGVKEIDVTLSNIDGAYFANILNRWCIFQMDQKVKITVIKRTLRKTKNLDVVAVQLWDFNIDIVSMRHEQYHKDSKVPFTPSFGSPLEDALRRDLSINSLFFNIHTGKIEDFTGTGIRDLYLGHISTPLEPSITLLDDPLRSFRVIRFASRFRFTIEKSLYNTLSKSTDVKTALREKISPNRIGTEIFKILSDPVSSLRAIALFYGTGTWEAACNLPPVNTSLYILMKPFYDVKEYQDYFDSNDPDPEKPIHRTTQTFYKDVFRRALTRPIFIALLLGATPGYGFSSAASSTSTGGIDDKPDPLLRHLHMVSRQSCAWCSVICLGSILRLVSLGLRSR